MQSRFVCVAMFAMLVPLVASGAERTGKMSGTIVRRSASANQLTVKHEDVPGLMGAMTMPYEVRGQRVADLPEDGATITATLHEADGDYWITGVAAATTGPSAEAFLMRQASGTSMNPAAAPMHMTMIHRGDWMLMLHGLAFVSQVAQSGPRGGDKLFSTNWVMGMASRPLGGGQLVLRSMLSLEPATVGDGYPELFQTGETLHGLPIVDAQHPHDFFMELAAEYALPVNDSTVAFLYAAPMGDPSLGPVAYPHRSSASEIPQAALSHHLQDSTHIAANVVTAGAQRGTFGFAASAFHGGEPDEKRWDIESGSIDSWAARATFDPSPNWSAQISTGYLKHPEALEPGNVQRTTASIAHSSATRFGQWDTSFIFGRNHKSESHTDPDTNAFLAESVLQFGRIHYATARIEIVDKDEILDHAVFRVKALTLGYSRDLVAINALSGAAGANVTFYSVPAAIKTFYGRNPRSAYVFFRVRAGSSGHSGHSMSM